MWENTITQLATTEDLILPFKDHGVSREADYQPLYTHKRVGCSPFRAVYASKQNLWPYINTLVQYILFVVYAAESRGFVSLIQPFSLSLQPQNDSPSRLCESGFPAKLWKTTKTPEGGALYNYEIILWPMKRKIRR